MSKPTPKQNFFQTMLTVAVLFLGFQLVMNGMRPKEDSRTPEEILQKMQEMNRDVLDISIAKELKPYQSKINALVKSGDLTEEQGQEKTLIAEVLVADTQYKAGISGMSRNDSKGMMRLNSAYHSVDQIRKKYNRTPSLWAEETISVHDVSNNELYGWDSWTPKDLYGAVVTRLSAANKQDLVLGIFPGYNIIDGLVNLTGAKPAFSYAFAAFILAIIVRACIWPLAQKQLMWSRQMAQLSPMIKEIQKRYSKPEQRQEMNMKVMELYKEYGINPAAGCLPALIQLPLFLLVYQFMLHYRFEFQKGTFLWINPQTALSTNFFTAPNLGQQDNVLIIIYGVSMLVSTLLTPVNDPTQKLQQKLMGVGISLFFTITMFFGWFPVPAAFVLYWTFTNIFATIQALRAYRMPVPPLVKVNAPGGGVLPIQPNGAKPSMNGQKKTGKPVKHKPKKRK